MHYIVHHMNDRKSPQQTEQFKAATDEIDKHAAPTEGNDKNGEGNSGKAEEGSNTSNSIVIENIT